MALGRTAELRTTFDSGNSGGGDVRFTRPMEAHVRYSDGTELVVLGERVYYRGDSGKWAHPDDGSGDGVIASGVSAVWRQLASLDTWRILLASSEWKPTGRSDEVNGRSGREYSGRAALPGLPASDYLIWVSDQNLPLRSTTETVAFGAKSHGVQDFIDWGKKVTIEPPV